MSVQRKFLREYGSDYGPSLYSAFIQPFVDVIDTTQAGIETAMSKTQMLVSVVTHALVSAIVPFIKQDYDAIFNLERRRMEKIESKYKDVFDRTNRALTEVGGTYDGAGVFFVLFPYQVIAHNIAKMTSDRASEFTKMTVDTVFDTVDALTNNITGVVTDPLRKKLGFTESIIREVDEGKDDADMNARVLSKFIKHDKIASAIKSSSGVKDMHVTGIDTLKSIIDDTVKTIKKWDNIDDVADFERIIGKDALDDLRSKYDRKNVNATIDDVLPNVINDATSAFRKKLTGLRSDFEKMAKMMNVTSDASYKDVMKLFDDAFKHADIDV